MKGYHLLTKDQGRQVVELYSLGKRTDEVASEMGISVAQVHHALHKNGIQLENRRDNACKRNDSLIRQMCSDGFSLCQMSDKIHSDTGDIKKYVESHNIPHPPFETARHLDKNYFWKGGRVIDEDGYVLIKNNDHPYATHSGYVREHRLVMEKVLGRYLTPQEVVHHKNGIHNDNRPENLELFAHNGEHLSFELPGKPHNVSPEGVARIREAIRQRTLRKRIANQKG